MLAQHKIETTLKAQSTGGLRAMAKALNVDTRDGAEIILSATLDELMRRLPDPEFLALCAELEAAQDAAARTSH